jgi:hypothetical protein
MQRRVLIELALFCAIALACTLRPVPAHAADPAWTLPAGGGFAQSSQEGEDITRFLGSARVGAVVHFVWTAGIESEPAQLDAVLHVDADALQRLPYLGAPASHLLLIDSADAARRLLPEAIAEPLLEGRLAKGAWRVEVEIKAYLSGVDCDHRWHAVEFGDVLSVTAAEGTETALEPGMATAGRGCG